MGFFIWRDGLTPRQQRFVREYLVDLNGTQAAIRAGYTKRSARTIAQANLRNPSIADAISVAAKQRAERLDLSADRVFAEYARIAFANMGDYAHFGPDGVTLADMSKLSEAQTAAIAEVSESKTQHGGTVRFKLHDKLAALNALSRHLGLGAPDGRGRDDEAEATLDAYEIARRIAFALKQGEAALPCSEQKRMDDE